MYDHDSMLILPLSQKHDMQIIPFWHLVLATECHYAIFRDYTVYATIKKLSITLKGTEKYKKMEKKRYIKMFFLYYQTIISNFGKYLEDSTKKCFSKLTKKTSRNLDKINVLLISTILDAM